MDQYRLRVSTLTKIPTMPYTSHEDIETDENKVEG